MNRIHAAARWPSIRPMQQYSRRSFAVETRNRLSQRFVPLTKDKALLSTADAASSHTLLLKAGFLRQSSSGIYSLLPLGLRVIEKISRIIDEEMQAIGGQKLALPLLLSSESWKTTGRWDTSKGEFFRLQDRKETDLLLAPTHEEEITRLVAGELKSFKQLPIRLYQIGRKYRDELRPRAGLLRGREFIMKDLYSFDVSVEDAYATYDQLAGAYRKIFDRVGVPFLVAEADSGNIGGSKSHEYHLLSPVGEDTLLTCSHCGYTANQELAVGKLPGPTPSITNENSSVTEKHTNGTMRSAVLDALNITADKQSALQLSYFKYDDAASGARIAAVMTLKGRDVNILKVQAALSQYLKAGKLVEETASIDLQPLSEQKVNAGIAEDNASVHVFLDDAVAPSFPIEPSSSANMVLHSPSHFRLAEAGDQCAVCDHDGHHLDSVKAIEVGHTFYLGTKYSDPLKCQVRSPNNAKSLIPVEMGCYGIGVSRLVASVAQICHDDRGVVWPKSLAPYRVCILATDDRNEAFQTIANKIYDGLEMIVDPASRPVQSLFGDDIVIDDRKGGFGSKMKDAELIGYPWIIVIGQKALSEGIVEIHERIQGQPNRKTHVPLDTVENWLVEHL
ncbi:uncharacterized protein BYT42DRAFT_524445 [Radiomyces spectabilis]|uniref:uncharacterized protein n=1 Tax=Radiomyces spectabilis TaxID=64574 RepID=UPI00222054DC|nr:uncharacterized protein BYT42DRAFT_524445 [Radiomyces spectabilis]KAI8393414.1 hypothetical protein BYT42DRAFT_524445 [Radiomyces spectabilis]